MRRLQCRESASPHNLFANGGDPQADVWCLQSTEIQCVPTLYRGCGCEVVKMRLKKRTKVGVGEVGNLDTQVHSGMLPGSCFDYVSRSQ